MRRINNQSGFTFIEALLYIILFTIVIGGGFVAAYQIIEGGRASQAKVTTEAEGNFVLRKIDWALNGANTLTVSETHLGINDMYNFTLDGDMIMFDDGGAPVPLTSDRVSVSSLKFLYDPGPPESVITTFELNGDQFGPKVRYVK